MLLNTKILSKELCSKNNLCYTCPLYLGTDESIEKGTTCIIALCEKEYKKLQKNHLTE